MTIKLNKEYEIKTTLGTIRDIEKRFNKGFVEIANTVASMTLDDQISIIFVGVRKAGCDISIEDFTKQCEEHLGIGDLMDTLEQYFYALQYPGLSESEVQDKIAKKLARSKGLQAMRGQA